MVVEFIGSRSVADHKRTVVLLERIHSIKRSLHHSAQLRTQFVPNGYRFLSSYVCYVILTRVSMETCTFNVVIQVAGLSSKILRLRAAVLTEKEKAMKVREGWWGRRLVKDENTKSVFFGGGI